MPTDHLTVVAGSEVQAASTGSHEAEVKVGWAGFQHGGFREEPTAILFLHSYWVLLIVVATLHPRGGSSFPLVKPSDE